MTITSGPLPQKKITNKMVNRYMKSHHLKNTAANRKRARNALKKSLKGQEPLGKQISVQETAADCKFVYGTARMGGVLTYINTADSHHTLMLLFTLCTTGNFVTGEGDDAGIQGVSRVFFDNIEVPFDNPLESDGATAAATGTYAGKVYFQVNTGTDTQAALSELITDSSGDWTSTDQQKGHAHIYIKLIYDATLFANGVPDIHFEVLGMKVFGTVSDPFSPVFRANPALCVSHFLNHFGAPGPFLIDVAYSLEVDPLGAGYNEAVEFCEDLVPTLPSGTEPRYTLNGVFNASESRGAIIEKMLSSFGANLLWGDNQLESTVIVAPIYREPRFELTREDLLSDFEISTVESMSDFSNVIRGTFTDPLKYWEETDFPPVSVETAVSPHEVDASFPCTLYPYMCERLGLLQLKRQFYGIQITFKARLNLFRYTPGDNFTVTDERFGWDAMVFKIQTMQMMLENDENGNFFLCIEIEAREDAEAIYSYSTDELVEASPLVDVNIPA